MISIANSLPRKSRPEDIKPHFGPAGGLIRTPSLFFLIKTIQPTRSDQLDQNDIGVCSSFAFVPKEQFADVLCRAAAGCHCREPEHHLQNIVLVTLLQPGHSMGDYCHDPG
jgi:hypothetical protein